MMIIGRILMVVGVLLLVQKLGLFTASIWSIVWPIVLIIAGLWMTVKHKKCCDGHDEDCCKIKEAK